MEKLATKYSGASILRLCNIVDDVLAARCVFCPILSDYVSVSRYNICCSPPEFVDCAQNVIADHCGEEIAQHLRTLVSQLLEELDCTSRKRL